MNLPDKFVEKMKNMLGDEYEAYEKSFDDKRLYGLRINTMKISRDEFLNRGIYEVEDVHWCKEGFYYKEGERPSKHPYYHAGMYYLQEPSAMSPGAVIDIEEGDRVLDICAAPGGKSTQVGARLNNTGVLVSNDISTSRIKALVKNIEIFGIKNTIITNESPKKLRTKFEGYFDKILIDAPCSGEGMFRKEPDVIKAWGDSMSKSCVEQQADILEHAAAMLKSGGEILYSTCTFAPEENEKSVNDFLDKHEDFEVVKISDEYGFEPGHPEWIENGREELKGCARLFPHKIKGEGHFLALLRHKGEKYSSSALFVEEKSDNDKRIEFFYEFCDKYLNIRPEGVFKIYGTYLYLLPKGVPALKGLRVIRSGWLLGELKKNRFEPSQAFVMGLKKEDIKIAIDLPLSDPNVIKYLKGETIDVDYNGEGWCVVLVDGSPLGWGKIKNGRIKNKYFVSWKWN